MMMMMMMMMMTTMITTNTLTDLFLSPERLSCDAPLFPLAVRGAMGSLGSEL
jgi:hypothetical protein